VRITGLHGPEAGAIEAALSDAAHHMSTLDVRVGALRAAVAPFALVREVKASASFPHTLRIRVVEQPPVAALVAGGTRTAVAADGVVLGPALISGSLPTLEASFVPAPGQPLSDESLRPALAVVAAAPAPMVRFITRAYTGKQGVTLVMKSGLSAYFGDASRPHAKWLALALVLANERSAGASYVDVRVPERPAAGYASGTAPRSSGEGSSTSASGSAEGSQESIAAALAAGLVKAVGTEQANAPAAKSAGPNPEEAEKAESKSHAEAGHEAPGGSEGASPESSARAGEEAGSGRSKTGP
jgi:cell division protein FtsQ